MESYGFGHISTGHLLREELEANGEHAEQIEKIQREGGLVDSGIVVSLLAKTLACRTGVQLVDGFPRNEENLVEWNKVCSHILVDCLLFLECSEEVMLARLEERAKTSGRADDNQETICKRIDTYHGETKALLSHYEGGKLVTISADGEAEDIFADLRFKIEQRKLDQIQAQSQLVQENSS